VINSFYLQAFWLIILVGCALILIKNKVGDNLKLWLVSTAGLNIVFSLLYFMKQGNKDARYPITFLVSFLLIVLIASSVKKAGFINKLLLSSVVLVFSLQLLNAYLPLGNFEIVAKIQDRPIVFVAKEFYTNFRMARQEWAVNKAMDYLKQNQTKFQNCQKSNYWIYKSTITVDLKDMDLHTNYGTIWGMAEEKNWTVEGDPSKSCLTIKGGFDYKNTNSNPLFFEGTNGYSVELINNI
jgi:hypothetical protein